MGCWFGTCMISNLPIIEGDDVKLVLLKCNNENIKTDTSYANDVYEPIYLPISGKYNDYGGIDNIIEDFNYNIIVSSLKKQHKTLTISDYNGDKIIEDYTFQDFLDGIKRDNLKLYDKNSDYSYVLIRQDIWDQILAWEDNVTWNRRRVLKNGEYPFYVSLKEVLDLDYKFSLDNIKSFVKSDNDLENFMNNPYSKDKLFTQNGESYGLYNDHIYRMEFYSDESSDTYREEIYQSIYEMRKVMVFVETVRKLWTPQSGAGSQSINADCYTYLSNMINNSVKVIKDQLEEEF